MFSKQETEQKGSSRGKKKTLCMFSMPSEQVSLGSPAVVVSSRAENGSHADMPVDCTTSQPACKEK